MTHLQVITVLAGVCAPPRYRESSWVEECDLQTPLALTNGASKTPCTHFGADATTTSLLPCTVPTTGWRILLPWDASINVPGNTRIDGGVAGSLRCAWGFAESGPTRCYRRIG